MNSLYPLKFKPLFKEKIWGGQKIKTHLNMDFSPLSNCGEAWILSGVDGENSLVTNGFLEGNELNELVEIYMDDLVGEKAFEKYGEQFPILVKIIDTDSSLSVQVHPGDELAKIRHHALSGKTEMWFVIQADDDAWMLSGFEEKTSKEKYLEFLKKGKLIDLLKREKVNTGDVFYIPAGTIHALGPGILLAEIQQNSDVTYRIYDWDRLDNKGKPRDLQTELATEAIDFEQSGSSRIRYKKEVEGTSGIVMSPFFNTNLININHALKKDYSEIDSFIIYICVEGQAEIGTNNSVTLLEKGEALLIPAETVFVNLLPKEPVKILEIYLA